MPIYEYRCDACNTQFDLRQKFSDPPADRCPNCGGTVRKLVSAVSFSLKGAGWFGDGYGTKAESATSEGDTAPGVATATEAVSTDAPSTETTASPASPVSAPAPVETKSQVAETPTTAKDKAVVSSQGEQ